MPIAKIQADREPDTGHRPFIISADIGSLITLFIGILALPLVSLSQFGIGPDVTKKFFLLIVAVVAIALWIVGRLQDGKIKLPWSLPMAVLPLMPFSFVVAAIFSSGVRYSLLGSLYQSGTALSILVLSVLTFLITVFFDSRKHLFNLYLGISFVALVIGLYYLLIIPIGAFLWPGIFNFLPQVLVGKWYETAVFFGFASLVSLLMLELSALGNSLLLKRLMISSFVVSLLMLMLTNFTLVWIITGIISLSVFVYALVIGSNQNKNQHGFLDGRQVFRPSFFFLLIALLFIILGRAGGPLNDGLNALYAKASISFVEVRPGWLSSFEVAKQVLVKDPLTGIGPSNFSSAWALYRPKVVNELQFWNINFSEAVGSIPTFFVTTGLVGTLAIIALFLALVYVAIKSFRRLSSEPMTQFLVVLSLVGMSYFWLVCVIYTPETIGVPMMFIMTGVFLATLTTAKILPVKNIEINSNPKSHFTSLLVLVLLLIVTIAGGYLVLQRFWSVIRYQQAAEALAGGNIERADMMASKAIKLNTKDPAYLRLYSRIKIEQLNKLVASEEGRTESAQPIIKNLFEVSIVSAGEAMRLAPNDYTNTMALGSVYEYLAGLGIKGAYEQAKASYENAIKQNPNNPEILLSLARLEITQNKFSSARDYLEKALKVKTNYSSSILLLSQLDVEDIGTSAAIKRLEQATASVPGDTGILFQLGFLRYRSGDYAGAVEAMQSVIRFSPNGLNANASYFLGLAYDALGEKAKAIEQFNLIARYNPDNVEVKTIINNLKSGRSALSGLGGAEPENTDKAEEEDTSGDDEETK